MMDLALYNALLLRFPRDEYVVLQEVTSADGARRADAIAIALWASRGQEMHGFEVKASRSDWLRELKEPAKAESMFNLCDRFWLVTSAADGEIVKDGELPPTWGWLELRGKVLRCKVKAPALGPRVRPWSFVCRLLRKCHDEARLVEQRQTAETSKAALEAARGELREDIRIAERRASEALAALRAAETEVGMSLREWNLPKLREAARLVASGDFTRELERVREMRDRCNDMLGEAEAS